MSEKIQGPSPRPCASCPYRRDVPAGIWDASEYRKLAAYDRDTSSQPGGLFLCHQNNAGDPQSRLCAGWVGCHGGDLLALRLALIQGRIDGAAFDYTTEVPLFHSGAEAAEHGLSGVDSPTPQAVKAIAKVAARRGIS